MKSAEKIKDLLWPEVNLCPLNLRPPCRDTTSTHTHTLNSETDKVWQTDLHMLRIGWTKPINQRQTKYDRLTCTDRVRPSQCSSSLPHASLMFTDLVCPSQCSSSIPHAKPMTDWRLQTWCVQVNVQSCLLSSYVPSVMRQKTKTGDKFLVSCLPSSYVRSVHETKDKKNMSCLPSSCVPPVHETKGKRLETNLLFHVFLPHVYMIQRQRPETNLSCHAFLPHMLHLYMRQKTGIHETRDIKKMCIYVNILYVYIYIIYLKDSHSEFHDSDEPQEKESSPNHLLVMLKPRKNKLGSPM